MAQEPALTRKFFSVEEANKMLPLVRAIVKDIVAGYDSLEKKQEGSGGSDEVEAGRETLHSLVEELQQLGVQVKDFKMGLVDFPHLREGREVNLCWRLGEERIGFWHDLESGFSSRRPV
jgi:hypothetical protein